MLVNLIIIALSINAVISYPSEFIHRVVNGTDADIHNHPYIVSLQTSTGSHSCGGSILNSEWILTAGHCIGSIKAIQYGVSEISPKQPNVIQVKKTIVHENYSPANNYENDIALIQLSEPIQFSDAAQPIVLPKAFQEFEHGTPAVLCGWGLEKTGGVVQKHLQKVDLIVFSDEECNKRHNGQTHLSNICGGVPEGGKGQCNGDSGGPLTIDGIQVGIVSWSVKPCTIAPYPGVYTKVSHFVDWIEKTVL